MLYVWRYCFCWLSLFSSFFVIDAVLASYSCGPSGWGCLLSFLLRDCFDCFLDCVYYYRRFVVIIFIFVVDHSWPALIHPCWTAEPPEAVNNQNKLFFADSLLPTSITRLTSWRATSVWSSTKIEKLNDSTFHAWKQKIVLILALKDLDDSIEDDPPINKSEQKSGKKMTVRLVPLSDFHFQMSTWNMFVT